MEERSLRVLQTDTTFFNRVSNTLTKLLTPTKIGINSMLISMKRNNVIKFYEQNLKLKETNDVTKKEQIQIRYDESYTLYLESIDKYIMDSVYKKVKNGSASAFEKNALANYYYVVHLKDKEYLEYKYRKQKFLLELDYESITENSKNKILDRFKPIYVEKIDSLYKGILKNYSIKLADGIKMKSYERVELYRSIFSTLEDYIKNVLPIKLEIDKENENYDKIIKEYEEFERFAVGKLDERDFLEKNMILLGLSRILFTHSLPLVAAEQCYNKLLRDTRRLIVESKKESKKEDTYRMLLKLIEDYNVKLLSTKVYWENQEEREAYKKFWSEYSKAKNEEEKEILALRRELFELRDVQEKNAKIIKFYKIKLVDFGVMRSIKDSYQKLENKKYIKVK